MGNGGAGGGHGRRPSNAMSFASTIPDSSSNGGKFDGNSNNDTKGQGKRSNGNQGEEEEEEEEDKPRGKILGIFPRRAKKPLNRIITLRPDPTPEEMHPFEETLPPSVLYSLIDPKSYEELEKLGGTEGILKGLRTNSTTGLIEEDKEAESEGVKLEERRRVFGYNRIPERKGKTLLQLAWMAYQDKVLVSKI